MIKVGDWVKVEQTVGRVVHVYSPTEEWVAVKLDDVGIIDVRINTVTKLPIKFKGFEIVFTGAGDKLQWEEERSPELIGYVYFSCEIVGDKYHAIINPYNGRFGSCDFNRLDQAKDWLELQYATMLAKARGLV